LWRDGKKTKTLKAAGPNDGKQKVKMKPSVTAGSGYKIRIRCAEDPAKYVESDAGFTITPAAR